MTITAEMIITASALLGALAVIYGFASKPFKLMKEVQDSLKEITETVEEISEDQKKQGDMVYQLLKHAATSNNTGEMQRALDEYNEYFRH